MPRLTLSSRLLLTSIALQTLMLALLVWNNGRIIKGSNLGQLERFYIDEQAHLTNSISTGLLYHDRATLAEGLSHLKSRNDFSYAIIFDRNNRVMASLGQLPAHPDMVPTNISFEQALQQGLYSLSSVVQKDGQRLGRIQVGFKTDSVKQRIDGAQQQNMLIATVALLLSLTIFLLLGRYMTSNLRRIEEAAKQFSLGNFDFRIHKTNDHAINELASAFNDLAENLQTTIQALSEGNRLLTDSEAQVRLLLDSSGEGIFGIDTQGICTFANPACLRLLGFADASELIGKNIHQTIHHTAVNGEAYAEDKCPTNQSLRTGQDSYVDDEIFWRKDGSNFYAEYVTNPVRRDGQLVGAVVNFSDISERKKQEQVIQHQARFDPLTDLPNRFLVMDRLTLMLLDAQRSNNQVAVLFLDLDDFKKVNDTLGHDIGDQLLIEASARLQQSLRGSDTVGRLGGDEFIMLLSGFNDSLDLGYISDNLLKSLAAPFRIQDYELFISASIGIAIFPDDGKTPTELLRNADTAMYHSKDQGRNSYSFFTERMNKQICRRLALDEQMHNALGNGEFQVYYQPKVDIGSQQIIGVEALLRWHNPQLGHVPPDEFIPIAEHNGLIMPIGEFVLKEAIAAAADWNQGDSQRIQMAINLSPRQFRDPQLATTIQHNLSEMGLANDLLELEITEGVLLRGYGQVHDTLNTLSKAGISIAMDDFGTGYSSLSYLRSYPFDVLKIDRSFVQDITSDSTNLELVIAIIAMAHSLGLKVVAEGIETQEQLAYLNMQGCDIGQGYLFSKPIPQQAISQMLAHQSHAPRVESMA
jgi:diguanylate cyclase (GGDEF)-like protein/PAS domain S-box-containing protein